MKYIKKLIYVLLLAVATQVATAQIKDPLRALSAECKRE